MYIHQFKKITNDYKVFIYQSFCDKNFNVSTYGIYNFGNNKKTPTHTHKICDQTNYTTISRYPKKKMSHYFATFYFHLFMS